MKLNELVNQVNQEQELLQLCEELCENITRALHKAFPHTAEPDYDIKHEALVGKKYIKIITTERNNHRSVWGFINLCNDKFKVGDVLKAAGWAKPTLNKARGNLFDGYNIAEQHKTHRIYGPDYL